MPENFMRRQAQIDALIEGNWVDPVSVGERMLAIAKVGMETPDALTTLEVQQVCYSLTAHYVRIGRI